MAKISGNNAAMLRARIDAGAAEADGVCTLRGKGIQRIAKDERGADVSLTSVYRTLNKMEYSCLAPRPGYEKQDPAAQKKFREESAPLL